MRSIFLIIALFFIFISFGCTGNTSEIDLEYRQGTKGIEISFMQNMPPSEVYDNSPIDLVVEVRNSGAYPQQSQRVTGWPIIITPSGRGTGTLYLDGFDDKIIMGMPRQISIPSIYGKSPYNPEGGFDVVTFHGNVINLDSQGLEEYEAKFMVTSCYNYETVASQTVCIDPEPYSIKQSDKVCTIQESYSFSGGQGGPVGVTNVKENIYGDKIYFTIIISNLGNGRVVDKNKVNTECPYSLDYNNLNKVYVSGKISGYTLICDQGGNVNLLNERGTVMCYIPKPSTARSAYTTPLQINLEYGYTSSITKSVKIINTP
ncbi:MAG: hypothetical protein PHV16_05155 [Candidatus Nanoarchaeia archaeon]|nr:hypothetical protein [Candidatus Nanoarchaeia archaeon]